MSGEFLCGSNCFAKPAIYHRFKMKNALLGAGNLRVERLLSCGKLHAGEGHKFVRGFIVEHKAPRGACSA